jgi:type II secretory pathway pseudopilin PulG
VKDAGYTLADTLGALAVVSLMVSGAVAGVGVYGRQQQDARRQMAETAAARAAQAALQRLLETQGPYRSDQPERFSGSETRLQFDCGEDQPCAAQLQGSGAPALQVTDRGRTRSFPLSASGPVRFAYVSEAGRGPAWPPASGPPQHLRAVDVVAAGAPVPVLVTAQVWREEPPACQFDPVLQDCR